MCLIHTKEAFLVFFLFSQIHWYNWQLFFYLPFMFSVVCFLHHTYIYLKSFVAVINNFVLLETTRTRTVRVTRVLSNLRRRKILYGSVSNFILFFLCSPPIPYRVTVILYALSKYLCPCRGYRVVTWYRWHSLPIPTDSRLAGRLSIMANILRRASTWRITESLDLQ